MMMKKLLLFVSLVSLLSATKLINHNCAHHNKTKNLENNLQEYHQNEEERQLQASALPRKMKITYNMSQFDAYLNYTNPVHKAFRYNAEKAIRIALSYLSDLIKIKPKPIDAMKYSGNRGFCNHVQVPKQDILQGKDSDLHLYITFTDDPEETYLAYAAWCRMLKGIGPTHGMVNFNYGLMKTFNYTNPIIFQDMIEIVIHEITHVLGFSGASIQYWVDKAGKEYLEPIVIKEVRGLNTTFLKTPNVLKHSQEYYGCKSLPGMPLENQGGSGSASSHWESTVVIDEIMNGMLSGNQAIFSKMTTSLLRDTGFYYEVSSKLEENSFFGKDAGCDFVLGECDNNSREFCDPAGGLDKCDYYHYGTSYCYQLRFTDNKCNVRKTAAKTLCYDEQQQNPFNAPVYKKYRGTGFGEHSRCFMSSLIQQDQGTTQEKGYCYNFQCNQANQVMIIVGDQKATCSKNGEKIKVPGYSGTIQCPEKLDQFCGYKQYCPNNCSTNGYCINSKCKCLPEFKGLDCKTPI